MNQFEIDLTEEQSRINSVIKKMKQNLSELKAQSSSMKTDIVSIRKNFWEDVTVNLDDAVEAGETATSIKQQAEFLAEKEHRHKHLDRDFKNLTRLVESPYFARIDFKEDGEDEVESIYLGIASYIDQNTDEFLVYDWRAPISSLYYDYSLGSAHFTAPGGCISGELKLKRQFIIKNGSIKAMFDTGVTIGDELLQEVLGKQSDSQMKSIVATIQQEQNKVIRNEKGKLLIVQGTAGSGKTSAALQRVAYLLYKYRDSLEAEEILLFSPNTMFNSYIRNVLPELGEENMQQTTFQNYLQHSLGNEFEVEDLFTQMEYMLTAKNDESLLLRIKATKYKSSFEYMEVMEDYLKLLSKQGLIFNDILFRGEILFKSEEIYTYFYSLDSAITITNRIKLVEEWLLAELKKVEKRERIKPWVEEEIQFLSKDEYQFYFEKLSKQKRFSQETFDDYDREQELLSKYVVKRNLVAVKKGIKSYSFINMKAIYQQLFDLSHSKTFEKNDWKRIGEYTVAEIEEGKIPYEDATPYLYLKEKIEGFKVNTTVKYVFIDEAQDYSAFQFSFLKHLFPNAKFTVLGDNNQAIYAHQSYTGLGALSQLFEEEKTEKIELNRSYRSTFEIVNFTSEMLVNKDTEIIPFNRQGQKPVVIKKQSVNDIINGIIEKIKLLPEYKSIAIICKTAEESNKVYELLKGFIDVHLVDKRSNEFDKGIVIIPAYLAKGIEFDAVIIFNASKTVYEAESLRNLFYTACTRAMHELSIFYEGELTTFVKDVSRDLYIEE
ncbi:DNA helicase-2/ATP-dependent DNA helicase PcrA [Metabacillus crassostreae]|uniref:RNA polymerase recycling motor HelD n=1 Tax=Metabacillus crassostreae TaxID=929098 RepID=UPI00195B8889|nr:RNA polymerase recycling motor HelD [Metabacillus crassostreae]MBM7602195.1 DNA helicase-2/ATP-dependent DNA helicase PcrA [Metabacillus crassostreae]